jgi:hypothetical protein
MVKNLMLASIFALFVSQSGMIVAAAQEKQAKNTAHAQQIVTVDEALPAVKKFAFGSLATSVIAGLGSFGLYKMLVNYPRIQGFLVGNGILLSAFSGVFGIVAGLLFLGARKKVSVADKGGNRPEQAAQAVAS